MTFTNNDANIKQFQLIKFINENSGDDHIMSKCSIVLRRDKIEAPYYMITKIMLSSCIDMEEMGLFHAMDVLNHVRRHNLTESAYNEIRELVLGVPELDMVKITRDDVQIKMDVMTRSDEQFRELFDECRDLFDKIDSLIG